MARIPKLSRTSVKSERLPLPQIPFRGYTGAEAAMLRASSRITNSVMRMIKRTTDQANSTKVDEALSGLSKSETELLYSGDTAYMNRLLQDAENMTPEAMAEWEGLASEHRKTLYNDNQRAMYDHAISRKRQSTIYTLQTHEAKQGIERRRVSHGDRNQAMKQEMVRHIHDPILLEATVVEHEGVWRRYLDLEGVDETEEQDRQIAPHRSEALRDGLLGMIKSGEVGEAEERFKQIKKQGWLQPTDADKVEEQLTIKKDRAKVIDIGSGILEKAGLAPGTPLGDVSSDQLATVRSELAGVDPLYREAVTRMVEHEAYKRDEAFETLRNENFNEGVNHILAGGTVESIPAELAKHYRYDEWNRLYEIERERDEKAGKGATVQTDWTYYVGRWSSLTEDEKRKVHLPTLFAEGALHSTEKRAISNEWDELQDPDPKAERPIQTFTQYVNQRIAGWESEWLGEGVRLPGWRRDLLEERLSVVGEQLAEEIASKPPYKRRNPTVTEMRDHFNRYFLAVHEHKGWVEETAPGGSLRLEDPADADFIRWKKIGMAEIEAHPTIKGDIVAFLQGEQMPYAPENIKQAYVLHAAGYEVQNPKTKHTLRQYLETKQAERRRNTPEFQEMAVKQGIEAIMAELPEIDEATLLKIQGDLSAAGYDPTNVDLIRRAYEQVELEDIEALHMRMRKEKGPLVERVEDMSAADWAEYRRWLNKQGGKFRSVMDWIKEKDVANAGL